MISKHILKLFLLLLLVAAVTKALPSPKPISNNKNDENAPKSSGKKSSSGSITSVFDAVDMLKGELKSDLLRGFVSDQIVQAECFVCKYGISYLQGFAQHEPDEDEIGSIANGACIMLGIQKPQVCSGYTEKYKHVISLILSDSNVTSEQFCGMAIEGCGKSEPFNWTVPINSPPKPPVESPNTPKKGAPIMRVLHISDVHVDPYYEVGSNANCELPLCCRRTSGKPKTEADKAGYWGDYRQCDIPLRTLENMLSHINETHKIDYVIFTGDISAHDTWNNTKNSIISDMHTVTNVLSKYFGHIPTFPALGNHESFPQNCFPPAELDEENSVSWLYDELLKVWSKWLPDTTTSTIKRGGYYSVLVKPNFRIISLNMNYCNKLNFWLFLNSTDQTNQLAWLADELQKAEEKGERVHILGHIPPGSFDCLGVWSENYNKIINRYENTVTAQFFGHNHNDEFQIFYDKSEPTVRPTSVAYIVPPVTSYESNPSYRIYTIDGDYSGSTYAVLDHETYFLNLTDANMPNKPPTWRKAYSAQKAYNMKSLLPEAWDSLVDRFAKNDELFKKFYRFHTTQLGNSTPCNQRCKEKLLCKLKRSQSNDPPVC